MIKSVISSNHKLQKENYLSILAFFFHGILHSTFCREALIMRAGKKKTINLANARNKWQKQ